MEQIRQRFSLDIGTNSIGWTVLKGHGPSKAGHQGQSTQITDVTAMGVRIFPDGRNPKDKQSLAVMRRGPRATRRRRDRFLKRQQRLIDDLVLLGLMPADHRVRRSLEGENPYALRAKGLDQALTPHELGRALFHLNQRRGFQSNRKTDGKDKDNSVLKQAAKRLRETIEADGCRTLGEFLYNRLQQAQHVRFRKSGTGAKVEMEFYPTRDLVKAEFEALWAAQASYHSALLTEDNKARIFTTIFYQRPLKPVKPGRCTLEPSEERLPAALPSVEARRIYQDVNELRYGEGLRLNAPLDRQQRDLLVTALLSGSKLSFDKIRTTLKLGSNITFNTEGSKDELLGCAIAGRMTNKKRPIFGPAWLYLPLEKKDEIVWLLLNEEDTETLVTQLAENYGLAHEAAETAAHMVLPEGYARLGATANAAILHELVADVVTYAEAAKRAGYHHSHLMDGEKLPALPYYAKVLERHVAFGTGEDHHPDEKRYGRIANPTVHIGLNQIRQVVNALIRTYGRPDEIVVELARELKQNQKDKDKAEKQNKENREKNEKRTAKLAELNLPDNARNRMLLRLFEEQGDGLTATCPYSGQIISLRQLFTDEIDTDHILPFSRTLDDSVANKVVCYATSNREKRNRPPFEAFGHLPIWAAIEANAQATLPKNKRWRFTTDAMERFNNEYRDFLARQLNETRHLARVAKSYLDTICDDVWVVTGQLTAMVRGKWGLNSILGDDNQKNRNDHRHHAIDAAAIGCISRSMLNELSRRAGQAELHMRDRIIDDIPVPFEGFRNRVRDLARATIVSYKPEHGKGGALHEDTAYGLVKPDNAQDQAIGNLVYRRPLDGLTPNDIERIRDPKLRAQLQAVRNGITGSDSPKAKCDPKALTAALVEWAQQNAKNGHAPMRHVRVLKPEASFVAIKNRQTGEPYKAVVPGDNWCMDVVSVRHTKTGEQVWKGFAATVFEVNQPNWRPQWERDKIGGKLVMRLHKNDLIEIDDKDGERRVKRVVRLNPSAGRVYLCAHNEAGDLQKRNDDADDLFRWDLASISLMQDRKARKVKVSPIGIIK